MDSLLPLLLFVVFFLFKALGNRKAPPPRQPDAGSRAVPSGRDDEMDEALRQIREALGMPAPPRPVPTPPVAAPTPPPLPPPTPRPTPPSRPPAPEFRERAPRFTEDAFERKRDTFVLPHQAPHLGTKGAPPPAPRKAPAPLRRPDTAEQAFLYAEVFGRPRSQRRLRG